MPGPFRRTLMATGAAAAVLVAAAALIGWLVTRGHPALRQARTGAAAPGTIHTIAGAPPGPGPAIHVPVEGCPMSAAGGYLYLGNGPVVQRIGTRTGWLTTLAGDGTGGGHGLGGPATGAELTGSTANDFRCATAPALDPAGNLLIAGGGHQIPDGVPAASAALVPQGAAAGQAGNVVIGDAGRLVVLAAVPARSTGSRCGPVTSTPWPAAAPTAVAVDAHGDLLVTTDDRARAVAAHSGRFYGTAMRTGYIYTVAGPYPGAHDVAVDQHGNVLTDDAVGNVVRMLAVWPGTFYGQQAVPGHSYIIAGRQHGPAGLGEGGPATLAWLDGPDAIAVGPAGQLLIAEYTSQRIAQVTPRSVRRRLLRPRLLRPRLLRPRLLRPRLGR